MNTTGLMNMVCHVCVLVAATTLHLHPSNQKGACTKLQEYGLDQETRGKVRLTYHNLSLETTTTWMQFT